MCIRDRAYSVGSKIRLLQMYGSNNSAVLPPVTNMRGEFVNRWQRPGDEEYTNVPGLLDAKSYNRTKTPWWNDKPYEFAGTIWNIDVYKRQWKSCLPFSR